MLKYSSYHHHQRFTSLRFEIYIAAELYNHNYYCKSNFVTIVMC